MKCVLKSTPEWKALSKEFGEIEAYRRYIANGYEVPAITHDDSTSIPVDKDWDTSAISDQEVYKLKALTETRDTIIDKLSHKLSLYKDTRSKKKDAKFDYVADLENTISDLYELEDLRSLLQFASKGKSDLTALVKRLDGEVTLENIQKIDDFAAGYDSVVDVIKYLEEFHPEETDAINDLASIKNLRERVHRTYVSKSKKLVADELVKYSTVINASYKQKYEKQYRENYGREEYKKEEEAVWVTEQMNINRAKIDSEEKEHVREILNTAPRDIDGFDKLILDTRNVNERVLQLTTTLLDKADYDAKQEFISERSAFVDAWQKYIDWKGTKAGITDHKDIYNGLIEKGRDGKETNYLVGEIYSEYWDALKEMTKKTRDTSLTYKEILAIKEEFGNKYLVKYRKGISFNKPANIKKEYHNPQYAKMTETSPLSEFYRVLVDFNKESDDMVGPSGALGLKLPSMTKGTGEQIKDIKSIEDIGGWVKQELSDAVKRQADDEGFIDKSIEVLTDEKGNPVKRVGIFYRQPVTLKDQSYDLPAMFLTNRYMSLNYKHKKKIVPLLEVVGDIMKERKVKRTRGLKDIVRAKFGQDLEDHALDMDGVTTLAYQRYQVLLEERLYGMTEEDTEILGLSLNKMTNTLLKVSAGNFLGFSYLAASSNLLQGKVQNLLSSYGEKHFSRNNLKAGEGLYWRDIKDILGDTGKARPMSTTNLLVAKFDVNAETGKVGSEFMRNTFAKRQMSSEKVMLAHKAGEHWISTSLMYAALDNMKVLDKQGSYLDKQGKPTSNREGAMSLAEAYNNVNGVLTLKDGIASVDKYPGKTIEEAEFKATRVIKDILADAQGENDPNNRMMIQRHWWGKLGAFLRKWMVRGFQRRWKGIGTPGAASGTPTMFADMEEHYKFYSEAGESYKEGTYTSLVRFMRLLHAEVGIMGVLASGLPFTKSNKNARDLMHKMSNVEKENIKAAIYELGICILALAAGSLLAGLAAGGEGEDDDNALLFFGAYISKRLAGDLRLFTGTSMSENLRMFSTPTIASVTVNDMIKTIDLTVQDFIFDPLMGDFELERYKTGRRKGQSKVEHSILKWLSFYKNGLDKDISESEKRLDKKF